MRELVLVSIERSKYDFVCLSCSFGNAGDVGVSLVPNVAASEIHTLRHILLLIKQNSDNRLGGR